MDAQNSHIDKIAIGDNVWVTQGKTEHMATFLGDSRKSIYFPPDYEGNGGKDIRKGTEVLEVLIRWATTGTKSFVPASTVRAMDNLGRRRRQTVNHFKTAPIKKRGQKKETVTKKKEKAKVATPAARKKNQRQPTDAKKRLKSTNRKTVRNRKAHENEKESKSNEEQLPHNAPEEIPPPNDSEADGPRQDASQNKKSAVVKDRKKEIKSSERDTDSGSKVICKKPVQSNKKRKKEISSIPEHKKETNQIAKPTRLSQNGVDDTVKVAVKLSENPASIIAQKEQTKESKKGGKNAVKKTKEAALVDVPKEQIKGNKMENATERDNNRKDLVNETKKSTPVGIQKQQTKDSRKDNIRQSDDKKEEAVGKVRKSTQADIQKQPTKDFEKENASKGNDGDEDTVNETKKSTYIGTPKYRNKDSYDYDAIGGDDGGKDIVSKTRKSTPIDAQKQPTKDSERENASIGDSSGIDPVNETEKSTASDTQTQLSKGSENYNTSKGGDGGKDIASTTGISIPIIVQKEKIIYSEGENAGKGDGSDKATVNEYEKSISTDVQKQQTKNAEMRSNNGNVDSHKDTVNEFKKSTSIEFRKQYTKDCEKKSTNRGNGSLKDTTSEFEKSIPFNVRREKTKDFDKKSLSKGVENDKDTVSEWENSTLNDFRKELTNTGSKTEKSFPVDTQKQQTNDYDKGGANESDNRYEGHLSKKGQEILIDVQKKQSKDHETKNVSAGDDAKDPPKKKGQLIPINVQKKQSKEHEIENTSGDDGANVAPKKTGRQILIDFQKKQLKDHETENSIGGDGTKDPPKKIGKPIFIHVQKTQTKNSGRENNATDPPRMKGKQILIHEKDSIEDAVPPSSSSEDNRKEQIDIEQSYTNHTHDGKGFDRFDATTRKKFGSVKDQEKNSKVSERLEKNINRSRKQKSDQEQPRTGSNDDCDIDPSNIDAKRISFRDQRIERNKDEKRSQSPKTNDDKMDLSASTPYEKSPQELNKNLKLNLVARGDLKHVEKSKGDEEVKEKRKDKKELQRKRKAEDRVDKTHQNSNEEILARTSNKTVNSENMVNTDYTKELRKKDTQQPDSKRQRGKYVDARITSSMNDDLNSFNFRVDNESQRRREPSGKGIHQQDIHQDIRKDSVDIIAANSKKKLNSDESEISYLGNERYDKNLAQKRERQPDILLQRNKEYNDWKSNTWNSRIYDKKKNLEKESVQSDKQQLERGHHYGRKNNNENSVGENSKLDLDAPEAHEENKQSRNKLTEKRKQQSDTEYSHPKDDHDVFLVTTNEKFNSNISKPIELLTHPSEDFDDSNSTANPTIKDYVMQQSMDSSRTKDILDKRIIDSDDDESDSVEKTKKRYPKNRSLGDPKHTIDRGYQWEWEKPQNVYRNAKNQASVGEKIVIKRATPENFGKRQPQSFHEAYALLSEIRHFGNNDKKDHLYVTSEHPILGNFVYKFRKEHSKFRKHDRLKEKHNNQAYREIDDKSPCNDMTRANWYRVSLLRRLGLRLSNRYEFGNTTMKSSVTKTSVDAGGSSDSETETEDEDKFSKVSSGIHTTPSTDSDMEASDEKNLNDLDDSDSYDSINSNLDDDETLEQLKRKKDRKHVSFKCRPAFTSSRDFGDSHIDQHAQDDEFLVVSKLEDIHLADTRWHRMSLSKATLPIQLYRLLRLSTLRPDLGLNKIIRWTDDGSSFEILDETAFLENILVNTSNIGKEISFRNALNQYQFTCVKFRTRKNGRTRRVFQHRSIVEAEEANDPSLREFYRGAPLDVMWKIKSLQEFQNRGQRRSSEKTVTLGKRQRLLQEPFRDDEDYSSDDTNKGGIIITNRWRNNHSKKTKELSREAERKLRRTSDGCLLPRHGAEQLLLEDGTYDKPRGKQPHGLFWDSIRGLWAPPHLLTTRQSDSSDEEEDDETSIKGKGGWYNDKRKDGRRTSDGCLLPKNNPILLDDGTYKQPKGHVPRDLTWDKIRGLWVPLDRIIENIESESDDDNRNTIIKASKVKLFHHSSSLWRHTFQPKKKKLRHRDEYRMKSFQARTKSNPSGIVKHSINLKNWRKIERLMQRASREGNIPIPIAPIVTSSAFAEEGEVRLI